MGVRVEIRWWQRGDKEEEKERRATSIFAQKMRRLFLVLCGGRKEIDEQQHNPLSNFVSFFLFFLFNI